MMESLIKGMKHGGEVSAANNTANAIQKGKLTE